MSTLVIIYRSVGRHLRRVPIEAAIWAVGLAAMASFDPRAEGLLSWCLFDRLGLEFCPGCGLGHAVAYLARGELGASLDAHPLGIPAVLVLVGRVAVLLREAWTLPGAGRPCAGRPRALYPSTH